KHFAIDCACFPGSSGSPIFLFNEGMYFEGESNLVMGKSRVKLIGVLYAGPQYDVHGEMVTLPIPTETSKIPTLRQMINIGFCVSSTQIEWFEELAKSLLENEKPIPL
ncbi:MAG: serine protease, partial [Pseudomonadota bacterium]